MPGQTATDNCSRWISGSREGFYESFFLRGNCPGEPRAFWIKFTVFAPRGAPGDAEGELWAIYFDGTAGRIIASKEIYPLDSCLFAADRFHVRVGSAELSDGASRGTCATDAHSIVWDLVYRSHAPSLHFLPAWAYRGSFPKAKGLAPNPDVSWEGTLTVDETNIDVNGWQGSQNHNWGTKHTDQYAWAQSNTFEGAPGTYMEMMSARLRLGPVWSPYLSFLALHHRGETLFFHSLRSFLRARVRFPSRFEWHLLADNGVYQARCRIVAAPETFAGLRYRNPPGGDHACLNSKIASSEITLARGGVDVDTLCSKHTTAFEILTDDRDHGVPILV